MREREREVESEKAGIREKMSDLSVLTQKTLQILTLLVNSRNKNKKIQKEKSESELTFSKLILVTLV